MRRLAVVLALAALPLAGCGNGDGASGGGGGGTPAPPAAQPVSLLRSGGIAGTRETVTVAPDGAWTHVGPQARTSGTLSADQRDRLTRMGADPALAAEAARPSAMVTCADGYDLALTVGGTTVRWLECGPDAAAPPLSAQIARLLADATD